MSEDGKQKDGGNNEPQMTEVEKLAVQMGWNPNHDPDSGREFKTAEQYILSSKDIQDTTVKTLRSVKKQNEELVAGMKHLHETHKRSMKAEKTRLEDRIAHLKAQRDEAIGDADKDRVNELDGQIETAKSDIAEIDQTTDAQPANQHQGPAFKQMSADWMAKNPWYGKNDAMTDYIDAQSERFRGLPPEMYFERLTEMAKATFPDYFKDDSGATDPEPEPKKPASQTVVGGQTRQGNDNLKKKYTYEDLSPEQKKNAQFFKRNGVMEIQEYVDEQVRIGNIGLEHK